MWRKNQRLPTSPFINSMVLRFPVMLGLVTGDGVMSIVLEVWFV